MRIKAHLSALPWISLGCLVIAGIASTRDARGQAETKRKPVVLAPPFENQSKHHETIGYEVAAGKNPNDPKKRYSVDRFTEAPRSVLENILTNIEGVTVVERQRVDALLSESEFGAMSGLVDPEKAVKMGKMLGANLIVMATITDLHDETVEFKGYGVENKMTDVICQIRLRFLDVETGKVRFSKIVKGTKRYSKSSYGETSSGDRHFVAVEAALEKLESDEQFRAALFGMKVPPAAAVPSDGLVEVEFAPKPENCDVEIEGKYVGGSPLKRRLPAGKEVKIRIAKGGYKEWEGVIVPEPGLRITRELGANR